MTDQRVRLGMAIAVITLISIGLYAFSSRARTAEPGVSGMVVYRR